MRRFVLSLTFGLAVALGAQGQPPKTPPTATPAPTTPTAGTTPSLPGANSNEAPAAPLPYAFVAVFTIVTLLILCMPTRKA